MSDGDNLGARGIGCAVISHIAIALIAGLAVGMLVVAVVWFLWR